MTPIKIILIILLIVILRAFLVQKLLLAKRLAATAAFFILLLLVVFPDVSTKIANMIGIGRGVDLIFYFSHLFLLLLIIALWRRTITLMQIITKLNRAIAIQNALKPDKTDNKGESLS